MSSILYNVSLLLSMCSSAALIFIVLDVAKREQLHRAAFVVFAVLLGVGGVQSMVLALSEILN